MLRGLIFRLIAIHKFEKIALQFYLLSFWFGHNMMNEIGWHIELCLQNNNLENCDCSILIFEKPASSALIATKCCFRLILWSLGFGVDWMGFKSGFFLLNEFIELVQSFVDEFKSSHVSAEIKEAKIGRGTERKKVKSRTKSYVHITQLSSCDFARK